MLIQFDADKRRQTLQERGLDFAAAAHVFEGPHITFQDLRRDYGEPRWVTLGELGDAGRLVVIVWTLPGPARRIISMRKANVREQALFNLG
jgi:uncharacterized protein